MAAALTVLVADDEPLTRASLREDLERAGIAVVAEAADGAEAVERALARRPSLCLLDVNMPAGGGITAATDIVRALGTTTSVVLISADLTVVGVVDALRAGAVGFLSKDIDPRRLAAAMRAVAAGESAFPRRELREALDRLGIGAA
jgi:DNA-binding NarL/FixJ family response regulator